MSSYECLVLILVLYLVIDLYSLWKEFDEFKKEIYDKFDDHFKGGK